MPEGQDIVPQSNAVTTFAIDDVAESKERLHSVIQDALDGIMKRQQTIGKLIAEGCMATKRVRAGKGEYDTVPDYSIRASYIDKVLQVERDIIAQTMTLAKQQNINMGDMNVFNGLPTAVDDRLRKRAADKSKPKEEQN